MEKAKRTLYFMIGLALGSGLTMIIIAIVKFLTQQEIIIK